MTTANINTANTEGVNFNLTYTSYDQTAAISSTNSPDNPGPPFTQGTTVKGTGDSDFVFVKATAAIGVGDVVAITSTFTAAGITTTNASFGNLVGSAVVAIASGAYGWVQRAGKGDAGLSVVAGTAPNVALYTTAAAGTLASAATTGTKAVTGVATTATNTTATSAATAGVLNYPIVGATN